MSDENQQNPDNDKDDHNPPPAEGPSPDRGADRAGPKAKSGPETAEDMPDGRMVNRVTRGEEINLTRMDPSMKRVLIALGWDVIGFEGEPPDLDGSVFLLDKDDQTREDEDFVFYNNMKGCDGAVEHYGDNRTGAGDGDDETMFIDLNGLPFDIQKVEFTVSIYEAEERGHSFNNVRNTFIRLINRDTEREICRYELDDEIHEKSATAMIVCHLRREGPNWFFEARGEPVDGGLAQIATDRGIIVAW